MKSQAYTQLLKLANLTLTKHMYGRLLPSLHQKLTFQQQRSNSTLVGRDFLTLRDYSAEEIIDLLSVAADMKQKVKVEKKKLNLLEGKSVALIFEKKSTRTRLSMETALALLGGYPIFLSPSDIHLGEGESLKDTALVVSRMCDIIFGRVYAHETLTQLSDHASVPVINGLSEMYHPLQSLADFLTLQEHFKSLKGLTMSWIGDGNNVLHSLMMVAPKLGVNMVVATPNGFEPDPNVKLDAYDLTKQFGTSIHYTTDPYQACEGTNVIVSDTWISMGQETEKQQRLTAFKGYQVTMKMARNAADNWCFLHCLPRKMYEVDDEVFYSDRSLVFQEAENRKWTAMALLTKLLTNYEPDIVLK